MHKKRTNLMKIAIAVSGLLFAFLFFSCNENDKDEFDNPNAKKDFSEKFFGIQDAQFVDDFMPAANSENLNILGLRGNSVVLAGGSNNVVVETSNAAKSIMIGVEGVKGHFISSVSTNTNGNGNKSTTMTLLLGQKLNQNLVLYFAASDGNGGYGNYETLEVNYLDAGTGILQVSLSWDQLNDVDLHLKEPDGEEIFYANSFSENGGYLDVDSNPACSLDYINNENIFYEEQEFVEFGEYEVLVDLWANCDIEGETNYTIVAYYNGEMITPTEGQNPHTSTLQPEDESHNSNLTSVMKFNISDDGGKMANKNGAYKFNFKHNQERPKVLSPNKL